MFFSRTLQPARLRRRYKHLADIITSYCGRQRLHYANAALMANSILSNRITGYSTLSNPVRQYTHSWKFTQTRPGNWMGVNTLCTHIFFREAIEQKHIIELSGYTGLKPEAKYANESSRIDLSLPADNKVNCYIEARLATLLQQQCDYFPDTVALYGPK